MKLSDITVNPENHHKYDQNGPSFFKTQEECLKAHMTLNSYLDDKLGGRVDWGAHYNSWLESFGIPANSDEGWWSVQAVEPDNIKLFVLDYSEPCDDYEAVPEMLSQLKALIPDKGEAKGINVTIESRADTVVSLLALNDIHIPESFCKYEEIYDE